MHTLRVTNFDWIDIIVSTELLEIGSTKHITPYPGENVPWCPKGYTLKEVSLHSNYLLLVSFISNETPK